MDLGRHRAVVTVHGDHAARPAGIHHPVDGHERLEDGLAVDRRASGHLVARECPDELPGVDPLADQLVLARVRDAAVDREERDPQHARPEILEVEGVVEYCPLGRARRPDERGAGDVVPREPAKNH